MTNTKFPRAPEDKVCAIRGRTWNQAASVMEAYGRFQVAPPLMLQSTPNGPLISSTGKTNAVARITGKSGCGASWYSGRLQIQKAPQFDPAVDITLNTYYQDAAGADDCWILDMFANGVPTGVHRLKTDGSYFVWGEIAGMSDPASSLASRPVVQAIAFPTGVILPCTLTNPSGSAGTNGDGVTTPPTQATYIYDIVDLDGTTVQTGVSVWFARQYGQVAAATKGIYFTDFASAWHIIACDEVITTGLCA